VEKKVSTPGKSDSAHPPKCEEMKPNHVEIKNQLCCNNIIKNNNNNNSNSNNNNNNQNKFIK